MRVSRVIITVLILFSFAVSFAILTQPFVRCDSPRPPINAGVDIEGAHMVSEGACFRFWIFNKNSFSVNVTINGVDTLCVPPGSGVDYDVVAPWISLPYEHVTYNFLIMGGDSPAKNVDFTVLVLNSAFVQIFDLAIPILVTIAAVAVALVAIVLVRRRRGHKKT